MGFFRDEAKTEKPTPKRLEEAREKGQIPKSQELTGSVVLLCSIALLYLFSKELFKTFYRLNVFIFSEAPLVNLDGGNLVAILTFLAEKVSLVVIPVFLIIFIVSIAINVVQTGFYFNPGLLKFDFSRINPDPMKFLKRLYSPDTLVEFVKSIVKMALLFLVTASVVKSRKDDILSLMMVPLVQSFPLSLQIIFKLFLKLGVVLVVLGVLDFIYRKWKLMQDLMMTREEVKEERKQLEGDPQIKARRRRRHIEILKNIISKAVPKADVVITNPVHLAVALQYKPGEMSAPKVVAKGAGAVAERIKKIAKEHGVPVIEDPPLARALYKSVEVGEEIPESLYRAVAEILARVYRAKRKAV